MGELSVIYVLCVFPLSFITICNVVTFSILYKRKSSAVVTSRRRHLTKFTRLSIAAGIFHCVCVVPIMVAKLIEYRYIENMLTEYQTIIINKLAETFLYINNAFSFILYSVSSKGFQQDSKQLLCKFRQRE
jgi:hypothetical protein